MSKKVSLGATLMLMAMTAAITITVTVVIVMRMLNTNIADFSQRQALFQKLATVDAKVRSNYIGTINENKLTDDILQGYIAGLGDKYSSYLTADDYKQMELEDAGKGSGLGVNVIESSDGYIRIVSVLSGSPAQTAGIKPNDVIVKISGQDVKTVGYATAVNLLRGDIGTTAQFTILRSGTEKSYSVVRKSYDTKTVESRMIGDIGYVRIIEFDSNTAQQFNDQVNALVSKGAKGIVFDVRNNPGGLLDSVEKMLDKLLPAGPVVRAKYLNGKIQTLYTSDASQINLPMAVLTNQYTASAAELFTAALKDYGKAKSVGVKTYGKGTMQQLIDLNDGTALDLSVARFYPPKSDNFEGKGVSADIPSTLSQDKMNNFYSLTDAQDDQLQAGLTYVRSLIS